MIGAKEWFGGEIKEEDGMYAYSDASNIVLCMVRGGSASGRMVLKMSLRLRLSARVSVCTDYKNFVNSKFHSRMCVVCGVSGLRDLVCICSYSCVHAT